MDQRGPEIWTDSGLIEKSKENKEWWARQDSNLRPDRYERSALTN
jgi:hypothetical protein